MRKYYVFSMLAMLIASIVPWQNVCAGPCDNDVQQFCGDVPSGGGRKIACLQEHADQLSSDCKDLLSKYETKNPSSTTRQSAGTAAKSVQVITQKGGRVDWSPQDLIAFDRLDDGGFYNVYSMKPDGSDVTCLTCDRDALGLPHKNVGQPAWHPSGHYLVVQAEKDDHPKTKFYLTSPGAGVFNDLWIIDMQAHKATRVVEVPVGKEFGVLHPHFSFDGKKLSWSEQYKEPKLMNVNQQFGYFKLRVGDFIDGDQGPNVADIKDYQPDGEGFYENHGFSPDDAKLIFSHNGHSVSPFKDSIYTFNLDDGRLTALTDQGYNEHALFSPDGTRIVWMTSVGNTNRGTDFWMMNADGSNKTRLTYFNQPGHSESTGKKTTASDNSWSPDGKQFVGYVQVGAINNPDNVKDYMEEDVIVRIP